MIFYDSLPVCVSERACFFFYIKFYVSSSLSYCWAIRPPLSFSFFLCPFSLHSPFSAPTLVLSLFLPVSLTLPYLSFFLSDFLLLHFLFHCLPSRLLSVWLPLSHTVSPSVFLSLSSVSAFPLSEGTHCWWLKSSFHSISVGLSFHLRQVTLS